MARLKDGAAEIFEWNKRKVLGNLLAMEEHLNELEEKDIPHSWCLVKHYLRILAHHLDEAIGHAERLGIDPEPYRKFRQEIIDLNIYPEPHVTEKDIVKLRSEWRRIIGDPSLTSDCPLCSKDITPEVAEKLREAAQGHSPELMDMEKDYADKVLEKIAQRNGKRKPPFVILDCGKMDPTGRAVATVSKGKPFIAFCSGGVSAHLALHEADHVWRHQEGKCSLKKGSCPEDAAESFALHELSISQILNTDGQAHTAEGKTTAERKEFGKKIGTIYGATIGSSVAHHVYKFVGKSVPTVPLLPAGWNSVTDLADIALGVGLPLIQLVTKKGMGGKLGSIGMTIFAASHAGNLVSKILNTYVPVAGIAPMNYQQRQTFMPPYTQPQKAYPIF